MTSYHRQVPIERRSAGAVMAAAATGARESWSGGKDAGSGGLNGSGGWTGLPGAAGGGGGGGSGITDPLTQRAVLEQMFDRKLIEGDFWYVVVAEWLEHLKKYLGIASTRKYYQKRVSSPPGPVVTRRDYAHTVDVVHEDAWRMLIQWYGLAEGHKPMKLVVFRYARGPEIEHNINSFKVTMSNAPPEDFHNVRFSKMEKVGHVEWKVRELYRVPKSQTSRLWAKADVDSEWRPVFTRDKAIGKVLEVDSDFTRPIIALELGDRHGGAWGNWPEGSEPTQEAPIGPFYEHSIFDDVTSTWEIDIHEQIDQIGKTFIEKLHNNFSTFVLRAKEYVDDRENHLRERERDICEREGITDRLSNRLEEKEHRLDGELRVCEQKIQEYDSRRQQLEREFAERAETAERQLSERLEELQREKDSLASDREHFDSEKKKMSEVYKVQESRIMLDIGGNKFTTSLLTLAKDPQSMLAAMFSGRHLLREEKDGSYFIDRDGTHFRYILNYLRDGGIKEGTLPQDEHMLRELMTEAEFYQLTDLVTYLQCLLYGKDHEREPEKEGDTFV